jgi:hypothetical protein
VALIHDEPLFPDDRCPTCNEPAVSKEVKVSRVEVSGAGSHNVGFAPGRRTICLSCANGHGWYEGQPEPSPRVLAYDEIEAELIERGPNENWLEDELDEIIEAMA